MSERRCYMVKRHDGAYYGHGDEYPGVNGNVRWTSYQAGAVCYWDDPTGAETMCNFWRNKGYDVRIVFTTHESECG